VNENMAAVEAIINGPAVVKFWPAAGEALGYTRDGAYYALKHGRFEVPVLNRGSRHFVLRSAVLTYLGVDAPLAVEREGVKQSPSPRADPVHVVTIRVHLEEVPRVEVVGD
jgi:hypothetical protein